ncbi:hypothetical protein [Phytomonospora endophytica]|uniref:Uncharacterized protein n=1 Tax=Phytomonospora endophytica TaxID=714109 RepID=A0A841FN21_9ACTN|nr:hypothetical protein [Phytomonospora endophytica]MBB6037425.1 hypothetical protein [Phytomonospora endophytica]
MRATPPPWTLASVLSPQIGARATEIAGKIRTDGASVAAKPLLDGSF